MHFGVVFQGAGHMCFILTVKEMKENQGSPGKAFSAMNSHQTGVELGRRKKGAEPRDKG